MLHTRTAAKAALSWSGQLSPWKIAQDVNGVTKLDWQTAGAEPGSVQWLTPSYEFWRSGRLVQTPMQICKIPNNHVCCCALNCLRSQGVRRNEDFWLIRDRTPWPCYPSSLNPPRSPLSIHFLETLLATVIETQNPADGSLFISSVQSVGISLSIGADLRLAAANSALSWELCCEIHLEIKDKGINRGLLLSLLPRELPIFFLCKNVRATFLKTEEKLCFCGQELLLSIEIVFQANSLCALCCEFKKNNKKCLLPFGKRSVHVW